MPISATTLCLTSVACIGHAVLKTGMGDVSI